MSKAVRLGALLTRPLRLSKRMSASLVLNIAIIALALVFGLIRLPASFIERFYSNGIYPFFQSALTPLTNLFPFAMLDALIIALAAGLPAWWVVRIAKAGRGRRLKTAWRLSFHTLVIASLFLLSFQLLWGFNYERKPLVSKLDYDEQRLTPSRIWELRRETIERLNAKYSESRIISPDETLWRAKLHASLNETVKHLGNRRPMSAAVPKTTMLNFYLSAAGIEGFVNPFGHEVILDSEILPFEKPFLLAHEWAHLAGFADESEANFVALLACLQSDASIAQYSGFLALYQYTPALAVEKLPDEIKEMAKANPMPRLADAVVADLKAIQERASRNVSETISRAQWAVYDRFLKASGVEAGVASYSQLVRLVAGSQFEDGWIPALRNE
jgi:uncharacterized protein DUF3810